MKDIIELFGSNAIYKDDAGYLIEFYDGSVQRFNNLKEAQYAARYTHVQED